MSRLARASGLKLGAKVVETFVGAIATLYFARTLGADTLGQYFLALAVVNWLLIVPTGVRTATTKRISEGSDRNSLYGAGLLITLALLGSFSLGVLLFNVPLANYLNAPLAGFVAALFFGKGLLFFFVDVLRGEDRVELASLIEGLWTPLRVLVQIILVVGVGGVAVAGLLVGEVVAAITVALVCAVLVSSSPIRPSGIHFRRIYEYARFSWFGSVKMMSYSWMDTIVLGFFVTSATVAVYEIAWRVSALFILLPTAVGSVIFPTVSRKASDGDYAAIEQLFETALTFAPLIAIPGAIGAFVIGEHVLSIYGEDFARGGVFLLILSIARILECFETLSMQLLNALDYPDRAFRVALTFTAINLITNVVFIMWIGAVGAAIATAVSMTVGALLAIRSFPDEISIRISVRDLGAQAASALTMGGVVAITLWQYPPTSTFETVVHVGVGALVYSGGVILFSASLRTHVYNVVRGRYTDSQM
jgi:O-antigen/teichoic acid export membrane protein